MALPPNHSLAGDQAPSPETRAGAQVCQPRRPAGAQGSPPLTSPSEASYSTSLPPDSRRFLLKTTCHDGRGPKSTLFIMSTAQHTSALSWL